MTQTQAVPKTSKLTITDVPSAPIIKSVRFRESVYFDRHEILNATVETTGPGIGGAHRGIEIVAGYQTGDGLKDCGPEEKATGVILRRAGAVVFVPDAMIAVVGY